MLVERGADLDVTDSFYGSRPIDFALRGGHPEVVLYLLSRRSKGAAGALMAGIRTGNQALVEAALATHEPDGVALAAAVALAERQTSPAITELVKKAASARPVDITAAGDLGASLRSSRTGRALPECDQRSGCDRRRGWREADPGRAWGIGDGVAAVRGTPLARRRCTGDDRHLRRPRRHRRADDDRARHFAASLRARRLRRRDLGRSRSRGDASLRAHGTASARRCHAGRARGSPHLGAPMAGVPRRQCGRHR